MPRSSRHKSSKRSSRDAKDYSDSERDSSLKDRKGRDESSSVRVSKDLGGSGEKRKLDSKESKDVFGSGNGDYEEYSSSSKRRKDRAEDSGNDRWNGGGEDDRTESGSRKSKVSIETKSKRRDDDELQRSKSEGKHRESSRKESREVERERERERERKGKDGKGERFDESEEHNKQLGINEKTEANAQDRLPSPESENQLERRVRRRKDGSGDRDKPEVDIGDINDRRLDNVAVEGRLKDEKHKDERYRDKYREGIDRDSRHRDDKRRDERPARDHTGSRSDDKHFRDEKDATETRQKKSKPLDSDYDREREYDPDRDHDERDFDIEHDHYRERDRDCDHDHDRNRDRDHDHNRDNDIEREWDQERDLDRDRHYRQRNRERERESNRGRDRNRDRDLEHDRDRDLDHDGSHLENQGAKYKDSKGKKRSPDERDEFNDTKSRGIKTHYPDMESKSLSSGRLESDADWGRSQSRHAYVDSSVSSRRRTSPSPISHGGDEYRHLKQEDLKYRDSGTEQRPKSISSREVTGFSGVSDRGSKYRSTERTSKIDDGHLGELSVERSSSSKASPIGLKERSPSSTSHDRRYANRTGIRRSLDIEETRQRSSIGPRDLSAGEDRLSRELPLEKPLADDPSQNDLLYYSRTGQSNSSSSLPPPSFRGGVSSPSFMGSLEEDGRVNVNARYRRSGDPSLGRGQGNAWRGAPNWSSSVPNGFMFQHGPPHGGFQAMMPQFPAPSLFTVRPSMDINRSGIPYHIPDADRFSGHLRPLEWQNMMDGSGPPHLHGWDGNNGVVRDEPRIYGGSDWDQNRHPMSGRGWETGADIWKGENGDVNIYLPSTSQKEDHPAQVPSDDALVEQSGQQTLYENNHNGVQEKSVDTKSISSSKKSSKISPKTSHEKTFEPSKKSSEDYIANSYRAYLAKLDISEELTAPELFSKCMSLLDMDQTATVDKETTVIVNLKNGGRAVPKSTKALLSPPFFPAADDSVFQRAMEQYKKQRVQISCLQIGNGGIVEKTDKSEELVLISDTQMSDVPIPISDQKKLEDVPHTDVQETLEELVSTPMQVVPDHNDAHVLSLEVPDQSLTTKSSEESVPVHNRDEMDGMTSKQQMISEDADGDQLAASSDKASDAAPILPIEGIEMSITKGNDSLCTAEERQKLADAISDPLVLSDGAPKVSEALMPGSNESELVILSRIHHSPEKSTH